MRLEGELEQIHKGTRAYTELCKLYNGMCTRWYPANEDNFEKMRELAEEARIAIGSPHADWWLERIDDLESSDNNTS